MSHLTYTECLQLKEHGFPQIVKQGGRFFERDGNIWTRSHEVPYQSDELDKSCTLLPSLSELIEACGRADDGIYENPFAELSQMSDFKTWEATAWFTEVKGTGSSPESAVCQLYLTLNPKK